MSGHHHNRRITGRTETPLSQNRITPAARAHDEAMAALTANDEAITTLEAQRVQLLSDEDGARAALSRGDAGPAVLEAITTNGSKAAALVPAIESLKAQRPALVRAVDQATGEMWAEDVRALAPEGTYVALQSIRDELGDSIREAVTEARAKADTLTAEAGQLIDQARQLEKRNALPRGASYSHTSGLKFDGSLFTAAFTTSLAEQVGRALDSEHATQVRTEAMARNAEAQQARAAENARVDDEHLAALRALTTAPAAR